MSDLKINTRCLAKLSTTISISVNGAVVNLQLHEYTSALYVFNVSSV